MEASRDGPVTTVGRATERARLGENVQSLRQELARETTELARSEARFRDVIERNADAIVVVDRQGVVRFANTSATELFGDSRDALIDSPFGFPLVADKTTELDLLSDGAVRVAEMRVVESEWEGRTAYIATLRDITERKRAEQNARELIREQAARTAAEGAAKRLRFLLESTTVLTSSLERGPTLSALARLCIAEIADWAVIYTVDSGDVVRRQEVAHRDPAKAALARELYGASIEPDGTHPVLTMLRTRQPILASVVTEELLASITQSPGHLSLLRELGIASFMMVPMIARGRAIGAVALVSADPSHPFAQQDLTLAEDIAARAALAVDNARLYADAQAANQTKTDFLAVLSHDLRTPLNAIIGYAELLNMGIPDRLSDGARERLQRIRTAGKHLLYLLNELLEFARLDAGHEELRLMEVDVREIVTDVAAVAEPLAQQRQLRLEVDLPANPVVLRTDPDKLRQVLLNLAGNAVKYTAQGEVRVGLHARGDHQALIRVQDTGAGIAPEHLKDIFEPFWQLDPTQRGQGGGTGLGLSIVRRLVQMLGGEVSVESEPGRGSTFTVTVATR